MLQSWSTILLIAIFAGLALKSRSQRSRLSRGMGDSVSRAIEMTKRRQSADREAPSTLTASAARSKASRPLRTEELDVERLNLLIKTLDKAWVMPKLNAKEPVGSNFQVSALGASLKAKRIAMQMGIFDFRGGCHWCYLFMKRSNLSIRMRTNVGQGLPNGYEEKVARFRYFVKHESKNLCLKDIGNMDEVPVAFDMPGNHTVDIRGSQDIHIRTTGAEKTNFTVVLCVTKDGNKCTPMIIFKRKTMPREEFPPGVIIKVNEKGFMNERVFQEWIEECWIHRPNPSLEPTKSLLVLDSARSHLTDDAKAALKERSKLAVVPGGLTKILQPLDVAVNKSFKSNLRRQWEDFMLDEARHTYTRGGNMRRASCSEVAKWVVESFAAVSATCIQNGFRRGLNEGQPVEEEEDESEDENELDLEEGEIRDHLPEDLPQEFVNAMNSLQMYTGDDFEGFV